MRMTTALVASLMLLIATSLSEAAQPTLENIELDNEQSMKAAAQYCEIHREAVFDASGGALDPGSDAPFDPELRDLCAKSFVCGGGPCVGNEFTVIIDQKMFSEFRVNAAKVPGIDLVGCPQPPEYDYRTDFTVQVFWDRIDDAKRISWVCGTAKPGTAIQAVLTLRRDVPGVLAAARWGGDAGLFSEPLSIPEPAFKSLVTSIQDLSLPLTRAFEAAAGIPCETNELTICTIVPTGGRLRAELLVPGTSLTGREGFWEKSVWDFAPSWTGTPGQYWLEIEVPITAYKRWPADKRPTGRFTSVDYDEGFERFGQRVMEVLSAELVR